MKLAVLAFPYFMCACVCLRCHMAVDRVKAVCGRQLASSCQSRSTRSCWFTEVTSTRRRTKILEKYVVNRQLSGL
jgi:hypothetical protein